MLAEQGGDQIGIESLPRFAQHAARHGTAYEIADLKLVEGSHHLPQGGE